MTVVDLRCSYCNERLAYQPNQSRAQQLAVLALFSGVPADVYECGGCASVFISVSLDGLIAAGIRDEEGPITEDRIDSEGLPAHPYVEMPPTIDTVTPTDDGHFKHTLTPRET